MSHRIMSQEAHTVYVERRAAEKERTTYLRNARAVKATARVLFGGAR